MSAPLADPIFSTPSTPTPSPTVHEKDGTSAYYRFISPKYAVVISSCVSTPAAAAHLCCSSYLPHYCTRDSNVSREISDDPGRPFMIYIGNVNSGQACMLYDRFLLYEVMCIY